MSNTVKDVDLLLKNKVDQKGYYSPTPVTHPSLDLAEGLTSPSTPDTLEKSLIPTEPLQSGEQYRFHFDMSRCIGCECCVVACNEQNGNPADVNWRRVGEIEGGTYPSTKRYHMSMGCNHCVEPSCLTGCPTDAYVKLEANGLVIQKEEECIGCQYCTWNCPYGVPQFNEDRGIVSKCDMCHGRLEDGDVPACAAACPEEAIRIEKVNVAEWRENHVDANAPGMPDADITLSTTRITLPKDLPEDVTKLNRHQIKPEAPHTSLIFMTVLTQLAAGGFLILWLGDLLASFFNFLKPLKDFLAFGAAGMLVVAMIALAASVFHLGRPLFAYKALKMWRRSWLSREVLAFTVFSFVGGFYACYLLGAQVFHFPASDWFRSLLGSFVAFSGMVGVYASAKIYMVPARPAWNTVRTPLRFFLTGFILGPLFTLFVYSIYLIINSPVTIAPALLGPISLWLMTASIAAFLQLGILLSRLFYFREEGEPELNDSTFLLASRFRIHFLSRMGVLVLGNFILPLWLFYLMMSSSLSTTLFLSFVSASFLLSLVGEFLGRYLFFVTVVPKNMPGGFFSGNGGTH